MWEKEETSGTSDQIDGQRNTELRSVGLRFADKQPNPTRSQDAPGVAMRKKRHVSIRHAETGNGAVGAVENPSGHFTTRTPS
jgi:hypothetical protein